MRRFACSALRREQICLAIDGNDRAVEQQNVVIDQLERDLAIYRKGLEIRVLKSPHCVALYHILAFRFAPFVLNVRLRNRNGDISLIHRSDCVSPAIFLDERMQIFDFNDVFCNIDVHDRYSFSIRSVYHIIAKNARNIAFQSDVWRRKMRKGGLSPALLTNYGS